MAGIDRCTRILALSAALVAGTPLDAQGAAFFASGTASGFCAMPDSHYSAAPEPIVATGACTDKMGTAQFSASSGSVVSQGVTVLLPSFGASGQIALDNHPGHVSAQVQTRAGYLDEVTFSGGPILHLEWGIDGNEIISGETPLDSNFAGFRALPTDTFMAVRGVSRQGDTIILDDRFTLDLPSAGLPITVQPELLINMSANVQEGDTRTYHALVDLSNTVRLVVAEVRDEQGHAVPGAVVTSALGIDYLHVPEPGKVALTGLAAASLALRALLARLAATHARSRTSSPDAANLS